MFSKTQVNRSGTYFKDAVSRVLHVVPLKTGDASKQQNYFSSNKMCAIFKLCQFFIGMFLTNKKKLILNNKYNKKYTIFFDSCPNSSTQFISTQKDVNISGKLPGFHYGFIIMTK